MPRPAARRREADLVARARRIITAQIAATVTFLMLLGGVVAYLVLTRDQSGSDQLRPGLTLARRLRDGYVGRYITKHSD